MVFDDMYPSFDDSSLFKHGNWESFYPEVSETIPTNVSGARGNSVTSLFFVNADHAECKVTIRFHTGVLLFENRSYIVSYSKRQNTIESSTFGSDFVAMKQSVDLIEALR